MSLLPQTQTKKAQDEVLVREPIAVDDTSDDESMVESEEDIVESHEKNSESWNIREDQEYEELHHSKELRVMKSEKEVPIVQVATYCHPHYFENKQ